MTDRNPTLFRFNDKRWLYKNESEPRRKLEDTTSKEEAYALLAWYLYTSPPAYYTSGSSEIVMTLFQEYICENSFYFITLASLLQK
jgi:hypothetical protein